MAAACRFAFGNYEPYIRIVADGTSHAVGKYLVARMLSLVHEAMDLFEKVTCGVVSNGGEWG